MGANTAHRYPDENTDDLSPDRTGFKTDLTILQVFFSHGQKCTQFCAFFTTERYNNVTQNVYCFKK